MAAVTEPAQGQKIIHALAKHWVFQPVAQGKILGFLKLQPYLGHEAPDGAAQLRLERLNDGQHPIGTLG
jgi:hypothetical protein